MKNKKAPIDPKRKNVPVYQNKENEKGEIIIRGTMDRSDALSRIEEKTFESVVVQHNGFLKSIIFKLVINNIPFTKINYGAGVYRVLKEERMSGG